MKKKIIASPIYFFHLYLMIVLGSCTTDRERINQTIISEIKDDKRLDSLEFNSIKNEMEADSQEFRRLINQEGKINYAQLARYVLDISDKRHLGLTSASIWIPAGEKKIKIPLHINVFVENSGSMDGYVGNKQPTDFKNEVYNFLIELQLKKLCDDMNLNYINNRVLPQYLSANDNELRSFIQDLDANTFRKKGGIRGTSDMQNVIDSALSVVSESNMSVLVTDAVFSPGNNVDAIHYLENQKIGLKNIFARRLSASSVSFLMLQLQSPFSGSYFDHNNHPRKLNGVARPYYIMVFGTPERVNALIDGGVIADLGTAVKNMSLLMPGDTGATVEYRVLHKNYIGSFNLDDVNMHHALKNAEVSDRANTQGIFSFITGVQFNSFRLQANYLTDSSNFQLSDTIYHLKMRPVVLNDIPSLNGYSHCMTLQSKGVKTETLTISLLERMPRWIIECNSMDDKNILNDTAEQQKTFGLQYLYEGIFEAYRMSAASSNKNAYPICKINIHIKT